MATDVLDGLFDNSTRDGQDDTIDGAEVDENSIRLSNILDGTTGTTLNGASTPLMNFTTLPYTLDTKAGKIRVYNNSGGTINVGEYVYVSAYNSGQSLYEVTKAVVTAVAATTLPAVLVMDETVTTGNAGNAVTCRVLTSLNTSGLTVGRPVYLSATAGGWSGTVPATANKVQIVGYVVEAHATTGRIIQSIMAPLDAINLPDSAAITFGTGSDDTLQFDGTDLVLALSADLVVNGGSIEFDDSEGVTLGTGKDATIQYDGTNLNINPDAVGSGRAAVLGNASVGILGTDGTLHVHTASAGSVAAGANYDDLVVENSGNTGLSLLTPDANSGYFIVSSPTLAASITSDPFLFNVPPVTESPSRFSLRPEPVPAHASPSFPS